MPELFTELAPVTSWSICILLPPIPRVFNELPPRTDKVSFALSTVTLIEPEPLSVAIFLNTASAFNDALFSLIASTRFFAVVFKFVCGLAPISESSSFIAPRRVVAVVVILASRFISESSL